MEYGILKFRTLLPIVKSSFAILAIGFIVYFTWQSQNVLLNLLANAHLPSLLISVTFWVILHFISPVFTVLSMQSLRLSFDYRNAFFIHTGRLPAKYLPGGIWHSAARAVDYHSKGIGLRYVGSYFLLENTVAVAVTLLIGGITVTITATNPLWTSIALISSVIGLSLLIIPGFMSNKLHFGKTLKLSYYVSAVLCMVIYWIFAACSFVAFLAAFPELNLSVSMLEAGGIYIFSWGIGYLALFAPQGIGVAEFVSSQLFVRTIDLRSFIVFLAGFRVLILIGDITTWLLSLLFSMNRQNHASTANDSDGV